MHVPQVVAEQITRLPSGSTIQKFVLIEGAGGIGYLRIDSAMLQHHEIAAAFFAEVGVSFEQSRKEVPYDLVGGEYRTRGGGRIQKAGAETVVPTFEDLSAYLGKFDEDLLRRTLDGNPDSFPDGYNIMPL